MQLRDIRRNTPEIAQIVTAVSELSPDVLLLLSLDHDLHLRTLTAFSQSLEATGLHLPHAFAPPQNAGLRTGIDLNGDGRLGTAEDAQGWGRYRGEGAMALLSRWPIDHTETRDHSEMLGRDLPQDHWQRSTETAAPEFTLAPEVAEVQRLSSHGIWEVPVHLPGGQTLTVLAWHAAPPIDDADFARNVRRNADENAFWLYRLGGDLGPAPSHPFVLMGNSNLDPAQGNGERSVMARLLSHPELQDLAPSAPHPSDGTASTATAWWPDGAGALRVDYLLPSSELQILDSGLHWPADEATHAYIWVDIATW